VTPHEGVAGLGVGPELARRVRASAVGLHCAVAAVASTLEALSDSQLPPGMRQRRSHELYGQLGDVRLALSQLEEALLPPPTAELAAVEAEPVVQVNSSRWLRRR
jgi:hypothetical protein